MFEIGGDLSTEVSFGPGEVVMRVPPMTSDCVWNSGMQYGIRRSPFARGVRKAGDVHYTWLFNLFPPEESILIRIECV